MHSIVRWVAAFLVASSLPALAQAQSGLVLPSGPGDFRALTQQPPGQPCDSCGVVTDIRSVSQEVRTTRAPVVHGSSEQAVAEHPIVSGNRDAFGLGPAPDKQKHYVVTVRYDNGSYAAFEQDDEPTVTKGELVRVRDGRVESR
jgi:hypothetical protein